jgi:hypothetical protein
MYAPSRITPVIVRMVTTVAGLLPSRKASFAKLGIKAMETADTTSNDTAAIVAERSG